MSITEKSGVPTELRPKPTPAQEVEWARQGVVWSKIVYQYSLTRPDELRGWQDYIADGIEGRQEMYKQRLAEAEERLEQAEAVLALERQLTGIIE